MSAMQTVRLVPCESDLTEKLEAVYERITMRAYEKWLCRSARRAGNRQQWFIAKNELFYKPKTEIRDVERGVSARLTCPDVEAADMRVFVTPTRMLVMAPMKVSDDRWLFRLLNFRSPIDPAAVSANYREGVLEISASYAGTPADQKARFKVA